MNNVNMIKRNEEDIIGNLLLEDLTKTVKYGSKERPRVRRPDAWRELKKKYCAPLNVKLPPGDGADVWVWSDQHFGHSNIINFSNRPFNTVDEMDQALVDNFNDYVGANDISIWVGDVSFVSEKRTNEILNQCNGYKILVIGNHDLKKRKLKIMDFDETRLLCLVDFTDVTLLFSHYPMFNMQALHGSYINVHGHLHINYGIDSPQHINVCCEYHNYRPVNLKEIHQWAITRLNSLE